MTGALRLPRPAALDVASLADTARSIARVQAPGGRIAWFRGGVADPWNHVEAAMGLDVAGLPRRAEAAYDWLRRTQNADGSWYRGYRGNRPSDTARESNYSAYPAVGVWHHYLLTGDLAFLARMWPMVDRALTFVLGLRAPSGVIWWARATDGTPDEHALLTGCASIYHALRCGLAIAGEVGEWRPEWEGAAVKLGHLVAAHPEEFADRARFSMDWYYPVLTGALTGASALRRIDAEWDRFVVTGLGARCIVDEPWVTGGETAELVLALCAAGDRDRAAALLADVQHLRAPDGSYWTGYVYPDETFWPVEQTTWTAGAMLLAAAMVTGEPATREIFGGRALPARGTGSALVCDRPAGCPHQDA